MKVELTLAVEAFPIAGRFVISRGAKTEARVVTATLRAGDALGRGECVPYARYGESVESVVAAIEGARGDIESGADRMALQRLLPAGAARNAVDCAMWDLEAKLSGRRAYKAAGFDHLAPLVTAYTLSVGTPEEMRAAALKAADRPLLKIKLAGEGDEARLAAVREGAPHARLIVDANEAWRDETLEAQLDACARFGVALVEQPLPAGKDELLARIARPIPVCADESAHETASLAALRGRYDAVNVKLDKTGGLTEALAMAQAASKMGFEIMAGCMVGTSLAMAPAAFIGQMAAFVDLDGPLLLARDREPGLVYEGSTMTPPAAALWG
ncbi:N-acetyl-D-Glu racemase DgcA [Methylocystis parvus]|uniref:Dipeptide epimerase n=1 Tax=Methylocystis parvus TaxID=134 RepID=A0A6B8M2P2_9HYPH|nr:N-acetyl-D-Glu racemase DgcA [Methylocystis parvus]QGM96628.1 dipeptide epimerase [Methylocystis parvus]WBJ99515.1 dipeptide epimerase [Methylocystis parvus OBBP]